MVVKPDNGEQGQGVTVGVRSSGELTYAVVRDGKHAIRVVPIGTWSSRFAEGGKVTVSLRGGAYRGQTLPICWDSVEVRRNEDCFTAEAKQALGICPVDAYSG